MLRQKMFFINLFLFLVISLFSTSLVYWRARQVIMQTISDNSSQLVSHLSEIVEEKLIKEAAEARILSLSPKVKQVLAAPSDSPDLDEDILTIREFFVDFQKQEEEEEEEEEYSNIVLIDRLGHTLVTIEEVGDVNWAEKSWWREAAMSDNLLIFYDPPDSRGRIERLYLNYPIWDNQQFVGLLRVGIYWEFLLEDLKDFTVGETGHTHLLTVKGQNLSGGDWDNSHRSLFSRVTELARTELQGQGSAVKTGHGPSLYAYRKISSSEVNRLLRPEDQLILLFYRSEAEVLKPVKALVREVVLIWLGLFVFTSIGVNYYTKKMIRPLEELKQGVDSISRGDLDLGAQVEVNTRDEVGALAESFNDMAATLRRTMISRDYLDAVFVAMGDMVIVTNLRGRITRVNRSFSELLEYDEKDLLAEPLNEILENSHLYQKKGLQIANFAEKVFVEEVVFLAKSGERICAQLSSSLIKGKEGDGKYIGVVNVAHDLRKVKSMIQALEEQSEALIISEQKYRHLIEATPLATVISQQDRIVYSNPAFNKMIGMGGASLYEHDFLGLIEEGKRLEIKKAKEKWRQEQSDAYFASEVEITLPNLGRRFVDLVGKPIEYEAKPAVLYLLNDVTEKKELQQRIFQGERMNAVGSLAAGVAHEFNNIIGGILGYAELAQTDPGFVKKLLEVIFSQGERVRQITQGLLSFARRREEDEELVNLPQLLDDVLVLLEKSLNKAGIKLLKNYPQYLEVFLSPAKLQQAIFNLLVNAQEAIGSDGEIEISVEETEGKEGDFSVIVKDSGCGIVPENLEKIFEPFFSTKGAWGEEEGSGMGLGLTHAYNLIKSMQGDIQVQSQPGYGSQFTITLPNRLEEKHEWVSA